MKKLLLLIVALLVLTSCKRTPVPEPNDIDKPKDAFGIEDYYPFLENTLLSYAGEGNEYAERKIFFDFIRGNRAQTRTITGGTTLANVLEVKDGELRLIHSREEFYYFEDLTAVEEEYKDILLKEPLVAGTKWNLRDGRQRSITGTEVEIETPSGKYKALEVTTEVDENTKMMDYYVLNIGHVLSIFKSEDFEVKTMLEEIKENTTYPFAIRFFYPDFENERLVYVDKQVALHTNDDIKNTLESDFKNIPAKDLTPLISENTKINSLILDYSNQLVKVDFSKELISEMNAGSLLEGLIIQGIVNTLGHYYQVEKVFISVDGEPYSSGHFMIQEDEYFTVNNEGVVLER